METIYNADAPQRVQAGFKELAVGTQADNPKKVYMIWEGVHQRYKK